MMLNLAEVLWMEWFYLLTYTLMGMGSLLFLFWTYRRHFMDDLECTKYNVFNVDSFPDDLDNPKPPAYCQLRYLEDHALRGGLTHSNSWVWLTAGLITLWLSFIIGAFVLNHLPIS